MVEAFDTELLKRALNDALNRIDPDGEVEYTGNLREYLWLVDLTIKRLNKMGELSKKSIVSALNSTWHEDWLTTTERLKLYEEDFNQVAEEVMRRMSERE